MNVIVVDDEVYALRQLESAVREAMPAADIITSFCTAADALEYTKENTVDIAFLDIIMPAMNGVLLAKQLKEINPKTNIIFVTGDSSYAVDAFAMAASGYITKPISTAAISRELDNLRFPVAPQDNGLRIKTFGNFEVFWCGKPIAFSRMKSKEIFAYLVDRGGSGVTTRELAGIIWGDVEYTRSRQIQLQIFIRDMIKSLASAGCERIVIRKRNFISLDTSGVNCDSYNFIRGDAAAINSYTGEYMSNYSWADFSIGVFDKRISQPN